MKRHRAAFILILFALGIGALGSTVAPVHHKQGHQNVAPWSEFRRVNCGALLEGIINQRKKIQVLTNIARKDPKQRRAIAVILPGEIENLKQMEFMYETVCREI